MVVDVKPGNASDRKTDHDQPRTPSGGQVAAAKSDVVAPPHGQIVEFHSTTILKVLGYCILGLFVLHCLAMTSWFVFGHIYLKGFVPLFSLENEKNIPTLFSSLQLFFAAVLLAICAAQHKIDQGNYFRHWVGLAAIFVFLSFDESAALHEKTLNLTRDSFGTSGLLYYSWIIPFGIFALVVLAT